MCDCVVKHVLCFVVVYQLMMYGCVCLCLFVAYCVPCKCVCVWFVIECGMLYGLMFVVLLSFACVIVNVCVLSLIYRMLSYGLFVCVCDCVRVRV